MTDINFSINGDAIVDAIESTLTKKILDNILVDIKDTVFDEVTSQDILDKIDEDDLAESVIRNIDYRDLAGNISTYVLDDFDVSDAIFDALGHYDYLNSDGLLNLMESYNPVNGCNMAKAATSIVGEGASHLISEYFKNGEDETGFIRNLADLVKVFANPSQSLEHLLDEKVVGLETVPNSEPVNKAVSLTYNEIKALFYNYNSMFLYYVTKDFPNNWEDFFAEAFPLIADKASMSSKFDFEAFITKNNTEF